MLKKSGIGSTPPPSRRWLWFLAVLDVMTAIWMYTAGDLLDNTSRLTAALTLGGHHVVVLWLAVTGFLILAAVAALTDGFAETNQLHRRLIVVASALSIVAVAGTLSVIALVVGVVMLVSVLGKAFTR